MAIRPLEREILRVVGGPPSILYILNNVQWTEDGDDLPHFSRRLLINRPTVWLWRALTLVSRNEPLFVEFLVFIGL